MTKFRTGLATDVRQYHWTEKEQERYSTSYRKCEAKLDE